VRQTRFSAFRLGDYRLLDFSTTSAWARRLELEDMTGTALVLSARLLFGHALELAHIVNGDCAPVVGLDYPRRPKTLDLATDGLDA
jgi:hypothetical protein